MYGPYVAAYDRDANKQVAGEMEGTCSTAYCWTSKAKPRATYYDMVQSRWVCYSCAREQNMKAVRYGVMRPCITGQDRMLELLMR